MSEPRPLPARTTRDVPTASGKKVVLAVLALMVGVLVLIVLAALFLAREENARAPSRVGARLLGRSAASA